MDKENRYTEWVGEHGSGLPGRDCYTRLAQYEDTGVTPEQISDVIEENLRQKAELARYRQMADCTEIHVDLGKLTEKRMEELTRTLADQRCVVVERTPHPVEQLRPCRATYWYKGESHEVVGRFHGWGSDYEEFCDSGPGNYTVGIVEADDGTVVTVRADSVVFLDRRPD